MSEPFPNLVRPQRVIDVRKENRVKSIKKLPNGDLEAEFYSGERTVISKDDSLVQEFVVYSVLAEL
jgi:hypothetical protein